MASFTSLLNDIYGLTKRPDLVTDTKLALKGATLKVHSRDFYTKDHYEVGLAFSSETTIQQFTPTNSVPLFRHIDYLRKSDVNLTLGNFFSFLTPEQSLDRYQVNKEDVAYASGNVINIRSSTAFQYAILGCWVYPNITEDAYSSWIADTLPFIIELEAAREIASSTGDVEAAAMYYQLLHGDPRKDDDRGYYAMLDPYLSTRAAI